MTHLIEKNLIKTEDLGNDWYARVWSDGSMTISNPEIGLRSDLPVESVKRLTEIFKEADRIAA